jgi:dTDP-L-rhamnose 4-epimerase
VASIFCSAIARGDAPLVFEDGGQRRDFVHVDDVARANLAALTAPSDLSGAFNVASGIPRSVLELAKALCVASEVDIAPNVLGGYRLGDVRHVFASPTRARAELGFAATTTDFTFAMRQFAKQQMVTG